jgi:hypothetical protein
VPLRLDDFQQTELEQLCPRDGVPEMRDYAKIIGVQILNHGGERRHGAGCLRGQRQRRHPERNRAQRLGTLALRVAFAL